MVACILTAVIRRILPRAPAFSFDAPAAGTGKTLLGQCMLRLCGSPPDMVPECRDEEELRKRLLSALRQGRPGILLDNIRGQFGSAALEGFLTSELYTDRVLRRIADAEPANQRPVPDFGQQLSPQGRPLPAHPDRPH